MKNVLVSAARVVEVVIDVLSRAAVVGMTVLVLVQVVLRYIFNAALPWVEEMTVFLMIWMAFMGAAVGVRRGTHIAMTMLVDRLPKGLARLIFYFSTLAVIAFAAIVVWQGLLLVISVGNQRSAALGVPMTFPYLVVPLGALLIILQALANVIDPPRPTTVDID